MLSLADPAALAGVHPERGCGRDALAPLLECFRGALRQLPPDEAADGPDLVRNAGLQGAVLAAARAFSMPGLEPVMQGLGGAGNLAGAASLRMQGLFHRRVHLAGSWFRRKRNSSAHPTLQ